MSVARTPCLPDTHALTLQQNSLQEGEPDSGEGASLFPSDIHPVPTHGRDPEGDPLAWAPSRWLEWGHPTPVFRARSSAFGPGTWAPQ